MSSFVNEMHGTFCPIWDAENCPTFHEGYRVLANDFNMNKWRLIKLWWIIYTNRSTFEYSSHGYQEGDCDKEGPTLPDKSRAFTGQSTIVSHCLCESSHCLCDCDLTNAMRWSSAFQTLDALVPIVVLEVSPLKIPTQFLPLLTPFYGRKSF